MTTFTREQAEKILRNEVDAKTLAGLYPELSGDVNRHLTDLYTVKGKQSLIEAVDTYTLKARHAIERIQKSGGNQKTLDAFLPDVIKARIVNFVLDQYNLAAQSGKTAGKVRFNLWDGFILQLVLFKEGLKRKPVSLFWFYLTWPFISARKILMPLVNKKGIYCFYSKSLVKELAGIIGDLRCLEIGSGDGTLTTFLKNKGVHIIATDDYTWESYIQYPDFVEKLGAKEALVKYSPEAVICSWPPPGNNFEKAVFEKESVRLYIVIGSRNPSFSGDFEAYRKQKGFVMEYSPRLSALVLPPSTDNGVFIFRQKREAV